MAKGVVLLILTMFGVMLLILRPGIFVVHPTASMPEGTTLVYLNKPGRLPVFSSTDTMCTAVFGEVSESCRESMLQNEAALFREELVQLPYMAWLEDLIVSKRSSP